MMNYILRFILDEKSGTVTVAHCPTPGRGECLDYERVKSYELTVAAQDENGLGFAVTVPLIIDITDVNDNAPRFILRNYVSYINETEQRPVPEIRIEVSIMPKHKMLALMHIICVVLEILNDHSLVQDCNIF